MIDNVAYWFSCQTTEASSGPDSLTSSKNFKLALNLVHIYREMSQFLLGKYRVNVVSRFVHEKPTKCNEGAATCYITTKEAGARWAARN